MTWTTLPTYHPKWHRETDNFRATAEQIDVNEYRWLAEQFEPYEVLGDGVEPTLNKARAAADAAVDVAREQVRRKRWGRVVA